MGHRDPGVPNAVVERMDVRVDEGYQEAPGQGDHDGDQDEMSQAFGAEQFGPKAGQMKASRKGVNHCMGSSRGLWGWMGKRGIINEPPFRPRPGAGDCDKKSGKSVAERVTSGGVWTGVARLGRLGLKAPNAGSTLRYGRPGRRADSWPKAAGAEPIPIQLSAGGSHVQEIPGRVGVVVARVDLRWLWRRRSAGQYPAPRPTGLDEEEGERPARRARPTRSAAKAIIGHPATLLGIDAGPERSAPAFACPGVGDAYVRAFRHSAMAG